MSFARYGVYNTAATAAQRLGILLLYFHAARSTTAADFGLASSLITLAITLGSVASLSLGQTINRTISRITNQRLKEKVLDGIFQLSLAFALSFSVIFLLFHSWIAGFVVNVHIDYSAAQSIGLVIFSVSVSTCLKGYAYSQFKYTFILISSVLSVVVLVLLFFFFQAFEVDLGLLHSYTGLCVAEMLTLFVLLSVNPFKVIFRRNKISSRIYLPILRFSMISTMNGLIYTPVNVLLISIISGAFGIAVVGKFNLLLQIRNVLVFIPNSFSSVMLTLLSKRGEGFFILKNTIRLAGLSFLTSIPVICCAFIFGPDRREEYYFLNLLITALTAIVIAGNIPVGQAFLALGKLWAGVFINLIWSISTILLVWLSTCSDSSSLTVSLVAILAAYIVHTISQFSVLHFIRRAKL